MTPYLALVRDIMERGTLKAQRAELGDGSKPDVKSLFGCQIRFNLRDGFPLITTRRIHFRLVVGELLWFLSGSTNNRDLNALGVKFWDKWADRETGDLGPIYGQQWRRWEAPGGERIDQIGYIENGIRAVIADPHASEARRLVLTSWNPADIARARGPMACHTLAQFNVTEGRLSCQMYQRSADMALGVPYNIACYALLTHLLAKVTGLEAGEYVHTFGDAHVYSNHFDGISEQLTRDPKPLPKLRLAEDIVSLAPGALRPDQFELVGYDPHPGIGGMEVAV